MVEGRVTDAERLTAYLSASADVRCRRSPDWSRMHELVGRRFLADTMAANDRWLIDYIHPDDQPHVRAVIDEAIRTKGVFELEHRVKRADGSWAWTFSRAVPILDAHGEIREWFGAASDVTARRETEARLRESEERLRQFGENSPDTLWIIDARAGRLEYLSAAYERMWGEPRERVMDDLDHWREHVHPDDRATVAEGLPSLLAGERRSVEYRIVRPDGETRWIFDTGFPIRDDTGRITRIAGVAQDLTALRETEEKMRESERRFRSLTEGIPQLIWRAVDDGLWNWASPQWTAFTGQPEEDSHGRGWLEMVHPDDRDAARATWDSSISTVSFQVDYRLRRAADGRYRWFTTRATPVHDDAGQLVEWLGSSTDIDDLRRLQSHQQLLLGELQHRVRNSLAVVRSIARRTAATSDTVDGLSMHLDGRLGAFARTQAAVTRDPSGGIDLRMIVLDELSAHAAREGEQLKVTGPEIRLEPKAGETLALAVHELATNAVKYGALSVPGGSVRVGWSVEPDGDGERLAIRWEEDRPGPPLAFPTRRGFGTELLESTLDYELEAETSLDFRPAGLCCTIAVPLSAAVGRRS